MRKLEPYVSISPLVIATAGAAILAVAMFGLAAEFPLGYALIGVVAWATANYFVEVIERAARGEGWSVFALETLASARAQLGLVALTLIAAAIGLGWAAFAIGGRTSALVLSAALTTALPASLGALAVTRRLRSAISPAALAASVARIGVGYALLVVGTVVVAALGVLAYRRHGFLEFLAALYGVLLYGYAIGVVVYSRRLELGVVAPRAPEARLERATAELIDVRRQVLAHAYGLTRGSVTNALKHLEQHVKTEADPDAARLWMFEEMARWEDRRAALAYGRRLAAEFAAAGRADWARKVGATCAWLAGESADH